MAISFNIPTAPAAFYSTTIERDTYLFRFKWQERNQSWYLDVETQNGTVLAKGSKLVPNMPLLRKNLDEGPEGNLYVVSNTDITTDIPSRRNIGPTKDFELIYVSDEELADAR